MDTLVALHRDLKLDQDRTRTLGQKIKVLLNVDKQRQEAESGEAVDSLLASNPRLVKEVWRRVQGW